MPEGDTVWRTARSLDRALSGRSVLVDIRVPQHAGLPYSASVLSTDSVGKHLLTRFDDGRTLHTHLKMEGAWHLYRPGDPFQRPSHEVRVVLSSVDRVAVGFALGVTDLIPTAEEAGAIGHLGPDLLGPDWDAEAAAANLGTDPERGLFESLLDQRNLAGIGNIYANEICFLLGRLPTASVSSTDPARAVVRARQLLMANRERVEQTTTGDTRRGRRTWVYGRAGEPCRRCRTRIRSAEVGPEGRQRIAFWCPTCQVDQ